MFIDKYKTEDWYEYLWCWHDSAQSVLWELLWFCWCWDPEEALIYVRDALNLVDELKLFLNNEITYKEWEDRKEKVFHSRWEEYFMWYFLSNKSLTEHWSSVPWSLTDEWKELLSDLKQIFPI